MARAITLPKRQPKPKHKNNKPDQHDSMHDLLETPLPSHKRDQQSRKLSTLADTFTYRDMAHVSTQYLAKPAIGALSTPSGAPHFGRQPLQMPASHETIKQFHTTPIIHDQPFVVGTLVHATPQLGDIDATETGTTRFDDKNHANRTHLHADSLLGRKGEPEAEPPRDQREQGRACHIYFTGDDAQTQTTCDSATSAIQSDVIDIVEPASNDAANDIFLAACGPPTSDGRDCDRAQTHQIARMRAQRLQLQIVWLQQGFSGQIN